MFHLSFKLIVCFLALVAGTNAMAESKIKLVTGNDYAPFTDQSLPKGGLATAVISTAFKEAGLKSEIAWKPWKRGYIESKQGRYIGTFPYIPTEERRMDFLYSEPIFTQTYVALSNRSEVGSYGRYEDMKGKTICRPVGYAIADAIEKNLKEWNISLFQPSDMAGCMKAIMRLPNHVVIMNRLQAMEEFKKTTVDTASIKVHQLTEKGFTLHFIVSKSLKDSQIWINKFNAGLKKIKESGLYDQLAGEFGLKPTMAASN